MKGIDMFSDSMQVYINSVVNLLFLFITTWPLLSTLWFSPSAVQSSRTSSLLYKSTVSCSSYTIITHHSLHTLVLFCPSSRYQLFYILDTTLMADASAVYRLDYCVSHYLTCLSYIQDFYFVFIIHVCRCFSYLGPQQLSGNVKYWHNSLPRGHKYGGGVKALREKTLHQTASCYQPAEFNLLTEALERRTERK